MLRKMSGSTIKSPFDVLSLPNGNEEEFTSTPTQSSNEINSKSGSGLDVSSEGSCDGAGNIHGNFTTTCRCCLAERNELIPIFDSDNNCIYSMIILLTSVRISVDDAFPKNICADCFEQLHQFVNFKQQVETADATLRQCINEELSADMLPEKPIIKKEMRKLNELSFVEDEKDRDEIMEDPTEEDYEIDYIIEYEAEPILYTEYEKQKLEPAMQKLSSLTEQAENVEENDVETAPRKSVNDLELNQRRKCTMYVCRKCDKKFNNHYLFVNHSKTHLKDKLDQSCPIFGRKFENPAGLESHMGMHRDSEPKAESECSFACDKCDMSFTIKRDLYIHGSIHADDGTFKCRECSKEFPNLAKLKRHVKTHFQDKPIKCEECGRGFPEMASLTRHFRIHTGEQRDRKYICSFCKKAYYDSHSLSIHILTHTGEKPWACDKCDKRLSTADLQFCHDIVTVLRHLGVTVRP